MPIRFAEKSDLQALVQLGVRMHALTRFKDQAFDAQKVADAFMSLIEQGQKKYVFLVAQDSNQKIVGGLIGLVEQQIFSDALIASVMHYDVLPEARMGGYGVRLLRAFEKWADNRKVIEINLGVNSGVGLESTGSFIQKMGYKKVGENFVKYQSP